MREQKDLALFVGIIAVVAVLASSVHSWLPQLLQFVGTNTNLIQGLADFIQILLWIAILLAFIGKLCLKSSEIERSGHNKTANSENEDLKNTNSVQSASQANKYSVEAKKITGFVQGENNKVTIHFKDTSSGD
jgi:uncharacterized membrane protein